MIELKWDILTLAEMDHLLIDYIGFIDGDRKIVNIICERRN